MQTIRLAISTCPNDTFAFHAILNRRIDMGGLDLQIELLDIQQLNTGLLSGRFDVAKASFHAATVLADQIYVLPSGSALGFGVGPLLLASKSGTDPSSLFDDNRPSRTLCPGELTTATMLFKLFYSQALVDASTCLSHVVFSEIMPALKKGAAEFGVCIHEGRFTWQTEGLHLVEDLGERWESETKTPLPLGGIVTRRSLPGQLIAGVQDLIRRSIEYGNANREETVPTMRKYAQEFDDDVLMKHVDLYVNDWTIDLGEVGQQALHMLSLKAAKSGIIESVSEGLKIWHDGCQP